MKRCIMKYILINGCYGGFSFSEDFMKTFEKMYPHYFEKDDWWDIDYFRRNEDVIQLYREKGQDWSSGKYSKLTLKEIPEDVYDYVRVGEYDGYESMVIDWKKAFYKMYELENADEKDTLIQSLEAYEDNDEIST